MKRSSDSPWGVVWNLLIITFLCLCTMPPANADAKTTKIFGLSYGPYVTGNPENGDVVTSETIDKQLSILAPKTWWIRSYGSTLGLENAPAIAHEKGLKVAQGAWLNTDPVANDVELNSLITLAKSGKVDVAVVGSEVLSRGDLNVSQLITYIRRVKTSVPKTVKVAYAETAQIYRQYPQIINEVDIILVNIYPFWEGIGINRALGVLKTRYTDVRNLAMAKGKPSSAVWIGETGWPTCGGAVGAAVPTPANAALYFSRVQNWTRTSNIPNLTFEAFDEAWKKEGSGGLGGCWGLFNAQYTLKPGMVVPEKVYNPPYVPTMKFTYVPPYGSYDNLRGKVSNARPSEFKVVVFIEVYGVWWIKPYWDSPSTAINSDGTFTTDITTGGSDELAKTIRAFLVPIGYPISGSTTQSSLIPIATDWIEVTR